MYTLHMSWSFRALVMGIVMAWVLAPQLACFMPDRTLTKSEMDCCEGMAGDCNMPKMSEACCQREARANVGIVAKVVRNPMPSIDVAERQTDVDLAIPDAAFCERSVYNCHAPPPLVSFSILRI